MYLEFRCTPYTSGGEPGVQELQGAVCITEGSVRFALTALCFFISLLLKVSNSPQAKNNEK